MSRFEGPQGIVTNGLVLNLDAGDPDSYTRSQPPYVEVLVVAGGGGTGYDVGGGGGAGGVIYNSAYQYCHVILMSRKLYNTYKHLSQSWDLYKPRNTFLDR